MNRKLLFALIFVVSFGTSLPASAEFQAKNNNWGDMGQDSGSSGSCAPYIVSYSDSGCTEIDCSLVSTTYDGKGNIISCNYGNCLTWDHTGSASCHR